MLKYNSYFYYSINDVKYECIDKVLAYNYEGALHYFLKRKKLDELEFLHLYKIVKDENEFK